MINDIYKYETLLTEYKIMRIWASGILIRDDKKILLLKRSNYTKAFPFYWWIPWGWWDEWETPEEVVIREVKEESWFDFLPTKLFHNAVIPNNGVNRNVHRFLWTYSWTIQIQEEEADGYGWYSYEETLSLKIAFDYSEILKNLHKEWYL